MSTSSQSNKDKKVKIDFRSKFVLPNDVASSNLKGKELVLFNFKLFFLGFTPYLSKSCFYKLAKMFYFTFTTIECLGK